MKDLRITPISFSKFALDGGAMFGIVPKTLWTRKTKVDEQNRIPLGLRSLLVEGPQFKALIDCGMGSKWDVRSAERYFYQNQNYDQLLQNGYGVDRKSITHVLLTHLHFDHAGGLTQLDADQKTLIPTFPNAEIVVHENNFKLATSDPYRERASYRRENFEIFQKNGQLRLLKGSNAAVLPGIDFEVSNGHTSGQAIYHMDSADGHYVFCGDLLPTRAHLEPIWGMGYDTQPLVLIEEKVKLLGEAVRNSWKLCFPHDPDFSWSQCAFDSAKKSYNWYSGG